MLNQLFDRPVLVAIYPWGEAPDTSKQNASDKVLGALKGLAEDLVGPIWGNKSLITFDAVPSETHSMEGELTEYPIETSADHETADVVNDHFLKRPRNLSYEAVITNSPMILGPAVIGQMIAGAVQGKDVLKKPAQTAYETLRDLWDSKTPVDIVTGIETYTNMMIESIGVPRTAEDGDSLKFSIKMKRFNFTETQTIPIAANPLTIQKNESSSTNSKPSPGAKSGKKAGSKPAAKADDAKAARAESAAVSLGLPGN